MRFSIGHRLFASVLLAILAVAVTAIVLMRQNVMNSFGEYALNIELDRLEQLSDSIAARYGKSGDWRFISGDRTSWIARDMARLQQQRHETLPPVPPAPPAPPVPPTPPVQIGNERLELPPPPLPPEPVAASDAGAADELGLQDRVTLLDASGAYLSGRPLAPGAGARRAIVAGGKTIGYLGVARASRPSDAMSATFLAQMKSSLAIIAAVSLALSALAATLLAAHFRKPIQRLAHGARELADGRYGTRLTIARSDELGELADSFNQLAQKLELVVASRRQWVADTSHELRTPLSVLRAQLEAMQDGVRPANADSIAAMLRQVLSLNTLIDQLYALARADVGELAYQHQRIDLWQLAAEQATAFEHWAASSGLALHIGAAPPRGIVRADPERLRQVLANLFENCIRYAGTGARIQINARQNAGDIVLTVDDSGVGVPDEALPHLGERFYRIEGSRSREHGGAGLGLALCQRIIDAHGGSLALSRSPLGGLRATIRLPLEAA